VSAPQPIDGDLLSGASLALAALAVLFGLWSPAIREALADPIAAKRADRGPQIGSLRTTRRRKAAPLATAAIVSVLVLLPPLVSLVRRAVGQLRHEHLAALRHYQAAEALFVVVWCLMVLLAVVTARDWAALRARALRAGTDPDR
jgi:hypothetical protein